MKTDIEISQSTNIKLIKDIAKKINIKEDDLELYGKYKAKLPLELIDEDKVKKSKLILVTALTPTPSGEGKTTVSIGLSDALNKLNKNTMLVLREPSLGPVFGIKGGATGGGYSQVIPMEDINLNFTGDFSAIEKANNLLSALIDNNLQDSKRSLNIDPRTIRWKRVVDLNDRSLRKITIGLGGKMNGIPREDGFNITAASEIMAILCLSNSIEDLKEKLKNILVGFTYDNKPIYAKDLNAHESMTILLKDAIKPNLVQTLEGNPALIHGGPFANIAQGTNSIIATKMGLSISDYVVTEAGFGADLGAEKFMNIKCGYGNLSVDAVVLVVTIRSLRHHGGATKEEYNTPSIEKVTKGLENIGKHIENIKKFGITPVVSINTSWGATEDEIKVTMDFCQNQGVKGIIQECWANGGDGAIDLAKEVLFSIDKEETMNRLYDWNLPIKEKIEIIAKEIYGAKGVSYSTKAESDIKQIESIKLDKLPICMAKTEKSFSDNQKLYGCPKDFIITVKEFEYATGAGFIVPVIGNMNRMPGLPSVPAAEGMNIDKDGKISGII